VSRSMLWPIISPVIVIMQHKNMPNAPSFIRCLIVESELRKLSVCRERKFDMFFFFIGEKYHYLMSFIQIFNPFQLSC